MGVATNLVTAQQNLGVLKGHIRDNKFEAATKLLKDMMDSLQKTGEQLEVKKKAGADGLKKLTDAITAVEATLTGPVLQGAKAVDATEKAAAAAVAVAEIFDPAKL